MKLHPRDARPRCETDAMRIGTDRWCGAFFITLHPLRLTPWGLRVGTAVWGVRVDN